jgi:SAM-dependent methyltransferase
MAVRGRDYWRCTACEARFLDPAQRLSAAAERAHYETHRNDPDDPGYRRFLGKLADALLARLQPAASILDYGCGPGPALAAMLREAGHRVHLYDPFFHPDAAALEEAYDAIACSETAEHFHAPAAEFARLAGLLRPHGLLAVMTCFQTDDARFADWHYRRDPTHVVFYREETLRYIAADLGLAIEIPVKDIAIMQKPAAP